MEYTISRIIILIYLQIHSSFTVPEELIACENEKGTITCATGIINISVVLYGRLDTVTCPHKSMEDTNCQSSTAYSIVIAECQGQITCTLSARNSIFGEPCKNTYKYLQVVYTCAVPTTTTTSTTSLSPPTASSTTTSPSTLMTTATTTLAALAPTTTTSITTKLGLTTSTMITASLPTATSTNKTSATKYSAAAGTNFQSGNSITGNQTINSYGNCYCICVDIDLDLTDPVVLNTVITALQNELLLDKKKLSRHKRTLTSIYEDRESVKVISVVGFSFIILLLLVVVLSDIQRIYSETCKVHASRKKNNNSLEKEGQNGTIKKYIYYNHAI